MLHASKARWGPALCAALRSVLHRGPRGRTRSRNFKETPTMRSKALILGSFIALLAVPAMAQGQNAINVFGVVDKMDATTISVKNDDGGQVTTYKLAPNVLYIQQAAAKLSDIKNNDF